MIKSELLYYLDNINRYESVTQAAEHLHMTQPALSIAIKRFEKELGLALLEKNKSKVTLTPDALSILKSGYQALENLKDIELFITSRTLKNYAVKDVTICCSSNLSYNILPHSIANMQKAFGDKLELHYNFFDETPEIIDYVNSHKNTLALISTFDVSAFEPLPNYTLLSRGPYYLKMNNNSKFFTNFTSSITIKEIKNAPIIFLGNEFINILVDYLQKSAPPVIIRAENLQMINAYIGADRGITTSLYYSKQYDPSYKYLKITDFPYISLCTFTSEHFPAELHENIIKVFLA